MKAVLHLSSFLLMIGLLLGLYQAIFPSISGGGGGRRGGAARVSIVFPAPLKTETAQKTALETASLTLSSAARRFFLKMKKRLARSLSFSAKKNGAPAEREGKTLSFFFDRQKRRFVAVENNGKAGAAGGDPAKTGATASGEASQKQSAFLIKESRRLRPFLEKYKSRSVWTVNLRKEAAALQALYPSKNALLKRRFPDTLHIYMTERRPIFLLLNPKGGFYPVFAQGKVGAAPRLADLPIARGKPLQKDKALRKQVGRFLQELPGGGLFSPENISEIFYKSKSFLLFLSRGDFTLKIRLPLQKGAEKNINFVLDYLLQKEEEGAWINAERPEKIIVRRRKPDGAPP